MAGGMDVGGGKGGKKSLDVSINLTPFIDLMAVTISFLIMTAVWTQIGRLQVSQAGGPATDEDEQKQEQQLKTVNLLLIVTPSELRLVADETMFEPIPVTRDGKSRLDLVKVVERFKEIKRDFPDQTNITLQTDDKVRYEDLVRIIDECIGAGLPQVAISAMMS